MVALNIWTRKALLLVASGEKKAELRELIRKEEEVYPGDVLKHWPIGNTVLWVTLVLLAYLLIYYFS
jgi:hypothetical protein